VDAGTLLPPLAVPRHRVPPRPSSRSAGTRHRLVPSTGATAAGTRDTGAA